MLPLIAVDIGNTRIKLGLFDAPLAQPLPHPERSLAVGADWAEAEIHNWLPRACAEYTWCIASVNRPTAKRLVEWLQGQQATRVRMIDDKDLALKVEVARPDQVGIDRLVDVVAANCLRTANVPAIVIDFGSAITVNLVSAQGAFAGGAILPDVRLSARALHEFTDLLPLVEVSEPPNPLGKSTVEAISSGLYWGAVGAVRELIERLSKGSRDCEVFVTGGAAPALVQALVNELPRPPQFVPHLTLAGIALTAAGGPTSQVLP